MKKVCVFCVAALFATTAYAQLDDANPAFNGLPQVHPQGEENIAALFAFTDVNAWRAQAGSTELITFEQFADGTVITNQLSSFGIANVTGLDRTGVPVVQRVTSSGSLPFPMFTAGTLPSEPNFISNQLEGPYFATGEITFHMSDTSTAIGAYVADGSPLGGFTIEVYRNGNSLGSITVGNRTLPDSFVGVVSDDPFDAARFVSVVNTDSWGLDNLELSGGCNGTEFIKKAKCKVKNGAVKKAIVLVSNATDGQDYTCDLAPGGQSLTQTANNGKVKFKFAGSDAPPCGDNRATVCGQTESFNCAC